MLTILTSVFILVLIWIALSIYHNTITSTIPEALSIQVAPISPAFDTQTLEKLKKRKIVEPSFELPRKSEEKTATPSSQNTIPDQVATSASQVEETISQ